MVVVLCVHIFYKSNKIDYYDDNGGRENMQTVKVDIFEHFEKSHCIDKLTYVSCDHEKRNLSPYMKPKQGWCSKFSL